MSKLRAQLSRTSLLKWRTHTCRVMAANFSNRLVLTREVFSFAATRRRHRS